MSYSLIYKMFHRHFSKVSYVAQDQVFFRQLCKMSPIFAKPTLSRRLKGNLQRCFQGVFYRCLEKYLAKISKKCFWNVLYTYLSYMSYINLLDSYARYLLDLQNQHFLGV